MTTPSVLNRPTDRPPRQERFGVGTTLSLGAHAALVAALWWGVHWRTAPSTEGTSAELWAAVPQFAAPPPAQPEPAPAPPPPAPAPAPEPAPVVAPKPPDIVTEQEKDRKLKEQQQQQQAAAQKAADDKAKADALKQQQLDQQKLAKLRQEQLARVMGQLGAPADSTGTDARNAGPSANYGGRIVGYLKPKLETSLVNDVPDDTTVEVEIKCTPDGTILSRRIVKSSNLQKWDDAVLRAIDKAQVLPRDVDGRVPSPVRIVWRRGD